MFVEVKRAYWITGGGGGDDVVSWIYCFGKGVAIFKLSYNYIKISLQNDMEKIINDTITLFLFNILKLLCSNFCTSILYSYINVCIELCGESLLRVTVYFTLD